MATKISDATLVAHTFIRTGKDRRPITDIRIAVGPITVAKATLGGKFSSADALKEYNRLPHRFTIMNPLT